MYVVEVTGPRLKLAASFSSNARSLQIPGYGTHDLPVHSSSLLAPS